MRLKTFLFVSAFFGSTIVQALSLDDTELDFDGIVSELSGQTRAVQSDSDPFDSILLHAGVGLASSYVNVNPEYGSTRTGMLTGLEATFGIDLFSRNWLAEGAFRSYNSERLSKDLEIDIREFDLKFLYHGSFAKRLEARVGAGVSARYLSIVSSSVGLTSLQNYTTPSSLVFTGMSAQLARPVSLGAEIAYRSTLVSETIDRSSLTASLRLDAHF